MQDQQVKPGEITYNTLIHACVKAKQPETALEIFEDMQEQGLEGDSITYNSLISALERSEQPKRALEVFQSMLQNGLTPNYCTYAALFFDGEDRVQPKFALDVFQNMLNEGALPNSVAYEAIVSRIDATNPWHNHSPRAIAKALRGTDGSDGSDDTWSTTSINFDEMVNACEQSDLTMHAVDLAKAVMPHELVSRGHSNRIADVIAYNALISACTSGNQPQNILKVFQVMREQGVAPDAITYEALMKFFEGNLPRWVAESFLEMKQQGIVPDGGTCNDMSISESESEGEWQTVKGRKKKNKAFSYKGVQVDGIHVPSKTSHQTFSFPLASRVHLSFTPSPEICIFSLALIGLFTGCGIIGRLCRSTLKADKEPLLASSTLDL
jgi:pentatricopeptide repeat domain-containing protein 1